MHVRAAYVMEPRHLSSSSVARLRESESALALAPSSTLPPAVAKVALSSARMRMELNCSGASSSSRLRLTSSPSTCFYLAGSRMKLPRTCGLAQPHVFGVTHAGGRPGHAGMLLHVQTWRMLDTGTGRCMQSEAQFLHNLLLACL